MGLLTVLSPPALRSVVGESCFPGKRGGRGQEEEIGRRAATKGQNRTCNLFRDPIPNPSPPAAVSPPDIESLLGENSPHPILSWRIAGMSLYSAQSSLVLCQKRTALHSKEKKVQLSYELRHCERPQKAQRFLFCPPWQREPTDQHRKARGGGGGGEACSGLARGEKVIGMGFAEST